MRIRWKLILLLLGLALIPLGIVAIVSNQAMQSMGTDLAERSRSSLVERSSRALLRMVEDHARVLELEQDVVELALKLNAEEIRELIRKGDLLCPQLEGDVAEDEPVWCPFAPQGFLPLEEVFGPNVRAHPNLIHWQAAIFVDGRYAIHPRHLRDLLPGPGVQQLNEVLTPTEAPRWTGPLKDPLTGEVVFIVSQSVRSHQDDLIGVAAVAVSIDTVLKENVHTRMLSPDLVLFMAEPARTEAGDRVRIIAQRGSGGSQDVRWSVPEKTLWLESTDREGLAGMAADLTAGDNGVRYFPYEGRMSMWVYGRIPESSAYLVFVVPREDVIQDAIAVEDYVRRRVGAMVGFSWIAFAGAGLVALLVGLWGAHWLISRIHLLLAGVRRVAAGNFSTRVPVMSNDEFGELARTFNGMVPEMEESVRIRQGLQVAHEVQRDLLPSDNPQVAGLDIAGTSVYSEQTGGDYYDFFDFLRGEQGPLVVSVGDVSGHGLPAALLMASARGFLRSRLTQPGDIAEVVSDVNRLVCIDTQESAQFVTLFQAEIDPMRRRLVWVRAGHEPGLIYDPAADAFTRLEGDGIALGLDPQATFTASAADCPADSIVLLGTDGVLEARNPAGEMFGRDRFLQAVREGSRLPARELVEFVTARVREFQAGGPQEDDITLVVIRFAEEAS
jgi:sigma-B regulation protein RsbU (phosphoserine phosphatase)